MKKVVSVILLLVFIVSVNVVFAEDYSSMTEEQLKEKYNAIRNELVARGLKAEKKTVLVDRDNIKIYISGDIEIDKQYVWDDYYSLFIPVVIINDTTHNINSIINGSSVNGWTCDGSKDIFSIPAGKKAKGNFIFNLKDTDVESIGDFTDVEFSIKVYDDNTWDDLFTTKPITVYAGGNL